MHTDNKELGLYIHVPFCKSKCYYCDFNSYACKNELVEPYFSALENEVLLYAGKLQDYCFKTIFIGGGTPSYVAAEHLAGLMDRLGRKFTIKTDAEITIEANPGTLSAEKLAAYRHMGINRLSMGLQAWQNSVLESIGRIHRVDEFVENYKQARNAGFTNINADLIFGLPGQTLENWRETLENVVELNTEHISCYSLKIEEGTVFGDRFENGELAAIDDELDREMYYMAKEVLGKAGYSHYEISNFARSGYECKHNLIYWKAEKYLGLGAGSHSYFKDERFNNTNSIEGYINDINKGVLPVENIQLIDEHERISEYLILGLRLTKGINSMDFKDKFGRDIMEMFGKTIASLVDKNLLVMEGDSIRLTSLGLDLANEVFIEFI